MWETRVLSLGWEDPLEEGMATRSSTRLENRSYVGGVSPWCASGSPVWFVKALGAESASGLVDLVWGLRICISCNDVALPAGLRNTL